MQAHRIRMKSIFMMGLAFIALTIPLFGCGSSGGGGGVEGGSSSPPPATQTFPNIDVSPTQITFDDVVLDNFAVQTISIQNTGSSDLLIDSLGQSNPLPAPFSILSDNCSGKSLIPSQTCTLQIRFSPTSEGEFRDSFDIPSNDPDENPVTVSVSGYGRGLNLSINQIYTDTCPQVRLLVTVADKNANLLSGLLADNFSLLENDVSTPIDDLSQVISPISVGLLLDYSNSMEDSIAAMKVAVEGFIDQLDSSNGDEASIIKFAEEFYLTQSFTTDQVALKAAVETPFDGSTKATALYDTVWFAVDETEKRTNRQAIIVVSDGQDNRSVKRLTEVIDHAIEKGVPVFTIGLGAANAESMQKLAKETGGSYFFAPTANDLQTIYLQLAEILAGQYVIEYNSLSAGAGPILLDLRVEFNGLTGRSVRAITGCP